MSLLRAMIRACAVGALRDKTWAEERVYDSDLTPLAQAVYGGPAKPYCVVYTDQDDVQPVTGVGEIYDGRNRALSLAVEIGIAGAVRATKGDPLSPLVLKFAATDVGMEWACDVVSAQVFAALSGDYKSAWGELFKRFTVNIRRVPSRRGGQASQGVRYAARRIIFVVEPMYDFSPGLIPKVGHPVYDFVTLARSQPLSNQIDYAGIIEGLLVVATAAPDWRVIQGQLGLTKEGIEAINAAVPLPDPYIEEPPLDYSDPNEFVPPLTDITLHDADMAPQTTPQANPSDQDDLGGP
jgi:hypothetical protein